MKNDLISRSALLEKAIGVVVYDEGGWDCNVRAVPDDVIEKAPAVDAVEVVRCKDCKYSELEFFADNGTTHIEQYICLNRRIGIQVMEHDDFCSYGERRADDAAI